MLDQNDPDSHNYWDRPVDPEDMKIKRITKNHEDIGERLKQLLENNERDSANIVSLARRGKLNCRDAGEAMNRIQKIYERELKELMN